jgi:hypothetical protein
LIVAFGGEIAQIRAAFMAMAILIFTYTFAASTPYLIKNTIEKL